MNAARTLFLVLILGLPLVPGVSAGETIGISPAEIRIPDAQAGETYLRRILVQNQHDTATTVTVEPTGPVAAWLVVSPANGLTIPPRSNGYVNLSIHVPLNASNASHYGTLRTVADPKGSVQGSGFSIATAASVKLNVSIGGNPHASARLAVARADDVEVGTAPTASARVVNDGNVRTTAKVLAQILSADGQRVLATYEVSVELLPGEEANVPMGFGSALPAGSYFLRISTDAGTTSTEITKPFKVVAPGTLGKNGEIRVFTHEAWAGVGLPLRIAANFTNTGNATIARAELVGTVTLDGKIVATFESRGRIVQVGEEVELEAFFTPPGPGAYVIAARVLYDGFETTQETSILNIAGAATVPFQITPAQFAAAGTAGTMIFWFLFFRRPRDRKKE